MGEGGSSSSGVSWNELQFVCLIGGSVGGAAGVGAAGATAATGGVVGGATAPKQAHASNVPSGRHVWAPEAPSMHAHATDKPGVHNGAAESLPQAPRQSPLTTEAVAVRLRRRNAREALRLRNRASGLTMTLPGALCSTTLGRRREATSPPPGKSCPLRPSRGSSPGSIPSDVKLCRA